MTGEAILITGATSGIGRALAMAFAAPERHLLLMGRDAGRMNEVRDDCARGGARVDSDLVDVRDRAAMASRIGEWDRQWPIGLVIANAGVTSGLGPGRDIETPEAVRAVLGIDMMGVLNTVEPLLEPMIARKAGQIAVVGSLAALRGLPSSPAYSAAKAAIHAYAEGLRPRLARHGIAVSIIAPGFVTTPLSRSIRAPRPLEIEPERAAAIIRRGIERRKAMIAFPLPLYAGLRLLTLLPPRFGDWLLDRPGIDVPETGDLARPSP